MQINIYIPGFWLKGTVLVGLTWLVHTMLFVSPVHQSESYTAMGGGRREQRETVSEAERESRKLRLRRAVLERREDIVRRQLDILKKAERKGYIGQSALVRATTELKELIADKYSAEQQLLAALEQLWKAQGHALHSSKRLEMRVGGAKLTRWPTDSHNSISAHFREKAYERHFGLPHDGLDIRMPQGTPLRAADDGVVLAVNDNGYGFSSVTFQSDSGIVYLYGHVSDILVQEGDRVFAGDIVAKSGGMPGTKGAGRLTTGPHLHLEVLASGEHRNPLLYLP